MTDTEPMYGRCPNCKGALPGPTQAGHQCFPQFKLPHTNNANQPIIPGYVPVNNNGGAVPGYPDPMPDKS